MVVVNIYLKWDSARLFLLFWTKPLFKKIPKRVQILVFCITRLLACLILSKIVFALGFLFMDELQLALAQFYPPSSGGMYGEFNNPPGPFSEGVLALSSENQNEPTPSAYEGQGRSFDSQIGPLLPEEQRRKELEEEVVRVTENGLSLYPSLSERAKLVEMQVECEIKLEEALRSDGYSAEKIVACRSDWRRAAFFPDSRPEFIRAGALRKTLYKYPDIRKTPYYRRVIKGIKLGTIHMSD